jgi:hypothetical protein
VASRRRDATRELDPIDEVARLLALNLKRDRGLQEVIVELEGVGIRQARIAELLGTTGGYVSVALGRAKAPAKPTKKSKSATGSKGTG